MRVGIVSNEFPPTFGGVGHSVRRIARGLVKAGVDVSVIVLPADSDDSSTLSLAHHQQISEGVMQIYWLHPAVRRLYSYYSGRDAACFEWLHDFVVEKKLDLLHCFYISRTGLITGLVARECKLPFIASVRGNDLHQELFGSRGLEQIRWTLQNADLITFVSASLRERAAAINHMQGSTRVIWNSVEPSDFQAAQHPIEIGVDICKPVIASAGEFRHKKGVERLLEACSILEKQVTLLLIGDFSRAEREYWSQYKLPNTASTVNLVITGMVPHSAMLGYFDLADVVVFPSIHDGCPNSFLEAMLAGRPIVCARAGAMGDIIDKSHGGIVVEPCSADRLATQIDSLIKNQTLCKVLGEQGRSFVLEQLTPEIETKAWLDCYSSLLEPQ